MPRPLIDSALVLHEPTHTYMLAGQDPGFASATEVIDGFFEPFDAPAIAAKLVETHPRYQGHTVEDLLEEWAETGRAGTAVHAELERYVLACEAESPSPKAAQGIAYLREHCPPGATLLPEVRIYSAHHRIAGTVDLAVFADGLALVDYKTNRKIDRVPYGGKCGTVGPAREWPDCHLTKYSLQLNLYAQILREDYGLAASRLTLVHLREDGYEAIPVRDMQREVEELLAWRASRR